MSRPQLLVIAGPNGAGKSTLTAKLGQKLGQSLSVVNPDDIAHRLDPSAPEAKAAEAGRIALAQREERLAKGQHFAIETTLTGKGELRLMERASAA